MFWGDDACETSGGPSAEQKQGYISGPAGELGFVSISTCSLLVLVSLFNNAEHTRISDSQFNTQIYVQGRTGL